MTEDLERLKRGLSERWERNRIELWVVRMLMARVGVRERVSQTSHTDGHCVVRTSCSPTPGGLPRQAKDGAPGRLPKACLTLCIHLGSWWLHFRHRVRHWADHGNLREVIWWFRVLTEVKDKAIRWEHGLGSKRWGYLFWFWIANSCIQ